MTRPNAGSRSFITVVDLQGLKHSVNLANVTNIFYAELHFATIKFANNTDLNFDLTKHPKLAKLFK